MNLIRFSLIVPPITLVIGSGNRYPQTEQNDHREDTDDEMRRRTAPVSTSAESNDSGDNGVNNMQSARRRRRSQIHEKE
jgi:hypothetical protein